ncbi:MAG: protoglobin domain-containing protein [Acidobacteriota bacterium]
MITEMVQKVLQDTPQGLLFSEEDSRVILQNKALLLTITDDLVKVFYDTLFDHPSTRAVFHEGERPAREETLRNWWTQVCEGPHDEKFWQHMAYVGFVHIKRKVSNTMMLNGMLMCFQVVKAHLTKAAENNTLPREDAEKVLSALTKLFFFICSLVTENFTQGSRMLVAESLGVAANLLYTLENQERQALEGMLAAARAEAGLD